MEVARGGRRRAPQPSPAAWLLFGTCPHVRGLAPSSEGARGGCAQPASCPGQTLAPVRIAPDRAQPGEAGQKRCIDARKQKKEMESI